MLTNKWVDRIRKYCESQYKKINVIPGDCHFNYRCHKEAVHYALKNNDKKIALVVYRNFKESLPCVHFLNYHDKKFVDNTIGYWCNMHEYRFIRWIPVEEFWDATSILADTKQFFRNMATPLEKLLGDIDN